METKPSLTAPVSRSIGVTDTARSTMFYRDVLGFEVRERSGAIVAVCGPTRIEFAANDHSSILFFETNDVRSLHAAIRSRGGVPSELQKVNWIKMEMFEVRDPDGNTLWFGQSYDPPHRPVPEPTLLQALPTLPFDDVAAAVAYYCEVLGFRINYQQRDLGVMDRDKVTLLLSSRTESDKGTGSAYIYVRDADALFAELQAKGANLQGEPVSHPWGLRDFGVVDLEGNQIRFGQPFE